MNKEQIFKTTSIERVNGCLNAIDSSMDHFKQAKDSMLELAAVLQEDDTTENTHIGFKPQPKNNEPLCISKVNYIAILSLEQLGVSSPTQAQIDTMESVILLARLSNIGPNKLTKEKTDLCMGGDTIANRILLRILKKGAH
jgi:hypothetical protein